MGSQHKMAGKVQTGIRPSLCWKLYSGSPKGAEQVCDGGAIVWSFRHALTEAVARSHWVCVLPVILALPTST